MKTNIKIGFKYHFYTEKNQFKKSHPKLISQYSMKTLKTWKNNQNTPRNILEKTIKNYVFS